MKRVLVTGASGFIGRHCLPMLVSKDCEVHAVSSRAPQESGDGVIRHQADLLELDRIPELISRVQPTHLLHLAWYAEPGQYLNSEKNLSWVQSSIALLRSFAAGGGERIVTAGTCFEYDLRYGYCSERLTPLKPFSLYGTCKNSLREITASFSEQAGISSAWARIFFLYGPNEHPKRLVPSIVNALLRREPVPCSHGRQIRDFLRVQDVAHALVTLLKTDVQGPVNICSGNPVRISDIISMTASNLNGEDLIQWGALAVPESEPPLIVGDVGRLRNEVGFKPKLELAKGLEQTIDWWKNKPFEKEK